MAATKIQAVAVVGKANNPLYLRTFGSHTDLRFFYIVHTSLDIIEERVISGTKSVDMYLGLLYSLEDLRVFGYMSNTKIKFVVVTSGEVQVKDNEMKQIFQRLHSEYTNLVNNPFYNLDSPKITSTKFDNNVEAIAQMIGI